MVIKTPSSSNKMVNAHRRKNLLDRIKIDGVWLSKDKKIKEEVAVAFHNLLFDTR